MWVSENNSPDTKNRPEIPMFVPPKTKWVSLIAGLECEMEWWNGKQNSECAQSQLTRVTGTVQSRSGYLV